MKQIQIACRAAEIVPLSHLKIIQDDLKSLSKENYQKLKNEILDKGFSFAVHVWDSGNGLAILDGTQRYRVLTTMISEGYQIEGVPVNFVEAKSEKDALLKLLSAAGMYGKPEDEGLYALMIKHGITPSDIPNIELPGIDLPTFTDNYFNDPQSDGDEDAVPETPKESAVKKGELYILGNHRLLCGDSTNKDDVERLMNGEKADMVFTDPPYGMNLDTDYDSMYAFGDHTHTGNRFKKIEGDDVKYDPSPILDIKAKRTFIWGCDYFYELLPAGGSIVAWDKRTENLDKVPGNTTEFCWAMPPVRRTSARILWSGHFGMNGDDAGKRIHPTQKPIKLVEWFFEQWGKGIETVVDIYLGSGSTLIACEKTNRKCYGMEIDPLYCQVILDRWAKYTGKDPMREDGKAWSEVKSTTTA